MKNLTQRAKNYLQSLQRGADAITDRNKIETYFLNQNVPLFEPVIEFGMRYSGYAFHTKTKKNDTFFAQLVSAHDINESREYDLLKEDNNFLFYCGRHKTAQFTFYINQHGQFCCDGYIGTNVLSSSFDLQVEQYAYKNELARWNEHPYYYELTDSSGLENFLGVGFDKVQECSDKYNRWYLSDDVIVQTGIWLHEPSSYVHFFGKTDEVLQNTVSELKQRDIIS